MGGVAIDRLSEIAGRVRSLHGELRQLVSMSFAMAKELGELLIEAKGMIHGGRWSHWVITNIDITPDTAHRYITIAKNWDKVTGCEEFPRLNVRQAFDVARGKRARHRSYSVTGQSLDVLLDVLDSRLVEYAGKHDEIAAIIEAIDCARPVMEEIGLLNSDVEARKRKIREKRRLEKIAS